MDAIRVLIVDDHSMVRRGLKSLLSLHEDIIVVGEAEDAASALCAAMDLLPEIVLLDIRLPSESGLEVTRRLREVLPQAKIIALTAHDNDEFVMQAMRGGARAYLLKSTSDESLVDTIRAVHEGRRVLSPTLMNGLLEQLETLAEGGAQPEPVVCLSDAEKQVLAPMARGATDEEIAAETHWSERTVKRRVARVVEALGARNRTQAVAKAAKCGLI